MNTPQIISRSSLSLLCLFGLSLLASPAAAQVFDTGPSDSALFTEVINMPADMSSFPSNTNLGGIPGGTIQLNIQNGGSVGNQVSAFADSEINITGGSIGLNLETNGEVNINGGFVGRNFRALSGSQVNISGGKIADSFAGFSGSEVNISGGTSEARFQLSPGSDVEIFGGEFQFNGNDITDGSAIAISGTQTGVFSATLADGSVLILNDTAADSLTAPTLTTTSLPQVSLTPIVVDGSVSSAPLGLRSGQTLTVRSGGVLTEDFQSANATLNIEGGFVGSRLEVVGGQLNVSGGTVGDNSNIRLSSNTYGINALAGSAVTISGGTVEGGIFAGPDTVVNINGGAAGPIEANSGSTVEISGGSFGQDFTAVSSSSVELIGGEFQLDGNDIADLSTFTPPFRFVLTGTLTDGSAVILAARGSSAEDLSGLTLVESSVPLPQAILTPIVVDTPVTSGPSGLRQGQTLTLQDGGELSNDFAVVDASLSVEGGAVGDGLRTVGGQIDISGGTVGDGVESHGGTVTISGGTVGEDAYIAGDSVLNITGGTIEDFDAVEAAVVNFSGGTVGNAFVNGSPNGETVFNMSGGTVEGNVPIFNDGTANISGGRIAGLLFVAEGELNISGGTFEGDVEIGDIGSISGGTFEGNLSLFSGDELTLIGTDFLLDGSPVSVPPGGTRRLVAVRNRILSGVFADGSPFSFGLQTNRSAPDRDFFDPFASLYLQDLGLPVVLLGDCDQDGDVDFLDIAPFISILSTNAFLEEADINQDGAVTFLDIAGFIAILAGN